VVKIKAGSLEVLDELREPDRRELQRVMNTEVLESLRLQEITFESSSISADKLKEDLFRGECGREVISTREYKPSLVRGPGGSWSGYASSVR
jgi:hypothetical protein